MQNGGLRMTIPLPERAAWREFEASEMWHRHRLQTDGSRSSWQCNPAERDYAMYLRSLFSRLFQQMAENPGRRLTQQTVETVADLMFPLSHSYLSAEVFPLHRRKAVGIPRFRL